MKQLILSCAALLCLLSLGVSPTSVQAQNSMIWHQTNGPQGGAIRDVAVDSTSGLWVATGRAGAYYSGDHGETWEAVNAGLPKIGLITIAAAKDHYVYAASINNQDLFRLNASLPRSQWRWEAVFPDSTQGPYNYVVTLANSNVFTNVGGHGVMRSTDHGTTWVQFIDTLKSTNCIAFAHGKNLFAVITGNPSGPTLPHPIWSTTGSGQNKPWVKRADFPDFYPSQIVIAHNGNLVATTLMKHQIFTKDSSIHGGRIWTSTDTGMTWTKTYERPDNSEDGKDDIDDIGLVDQTGTIYANAHGITIRSTDNGMTWTTLDSEKRGDERFKIASNPDETHTYQICEPDGVFRSDDHGATFVGKYSGIKVEFLYGMDINSRQDLFALYEFGLSRSTDHGNTWGEAVEFGETYFPTFIISRNPATRDHIYIGCEYGFFRSTDFGETILPIQSSGGDTIFRQLGMTSSGKLFTYFTSSNGSRVMYSTNEGDSWTPVTNLPDPTDDIRGLAVTSDTIALAGTGPSFYLSVNGGGKWTTSTTTAPFNQPSKMLFHSDGSLLALVPGNGAKSGCWRSTDAGATWTHIFPFVDAPTEQFRNDYYSLNVDDLGQIFIGSDSGIWRTSLPPYTVWKNVSTGLTWPDWDRPLFVNVSDVVQDPVSRKYYAATRGLSVYESVPNMDDVPATPVTATGSRVVNYPNPFASSTNISFTLDAPSQVTLDVYDAIGRHIGQTVTSSFDAGQHQLPFDGSALPNGNYLVTLRINGGIRSTWMTIAR